MADQERKRAGSKEGCEGSVEGPGLERTHSTPCASHWPALKSQGLMEWKGSCSLVVCPGGRNPWYHILV